MSNGVKPIEQHHPSFCISGMGRSGSLWLSQLMNRSARWTVRHEPHNEYDLDAISLRFREETAKGPYAEINSFANFCLLDLPVRERGVLIRDPIEILISYANRNPHELRWQISSDALTIEGAFLDHLSASLATIDLAIKKGVRPISFVSMTTKLDYLTQQLRTFDVWDVEPMQADLETKTNTAGREALAGWMSLDRLTRGRIERRLRWYRKRYAVYGAKTTHDPDVP
jgi:hypothetical protein